MRLIAILLISFLFSYPIYSQKRRVKNLQSYDKHFLHFGFYLSLNQYDFDIKYRNNFRELDSLYLLQSEPQKGFNLGIVSNMRIYDCLSLRFMPGLTFADRKLNYTFIEHDTIVFTSSKLVEATFIDFPLYIKYKSMRVNNFRAFLLAGTKFSLDLISQEKVEQNYKDIMIRLNKYDLNYEIGAGFDYFYEFFKFSVEFIYSHGFFNKLVYDSSLYSRSIDKLMTRSFTINFTFEGGLGNW